MAGRLALIAALIVAATAVFLMSGGLGEGQETTKCPANVTPADAVCIEYAENGSGAVPTYAAVDPEKKDVTWSKQTGGSNNADEGLFDIDPASGRLTFNTPPDFENPADAGTDNLYEVTIQANDASADLASGYRSSADPRVSKTLRVTVTNVDEVGEVTLPTLQPQEGTAITATLTDPDGNPSGVTGDLHS